MSSVVPTCFTAVVQMFLGTSKIWIAPVSCFVMRMRGHFFGNILSTHDVTCARKSMTQMNANVSLNFAHPCLFRQPMLQLNDRYPGFATAMFCFDV